MDKEDVTRKKEKLIRLLQDAGSLIVGFSGGIDSTFLLAVAHETLGARAVAATAVSDIYSTGEKDAAAEFTRDKGIEHVFFRLEVMSLAAFLSNEPDRCYHCKKHLFQKLVKIAQNRGLKHVAHAANIDDKDTPIEYRPGREAAIEMGIISPLVAAGLQKQEIRFLSKEMGLSQWDKPARACLAWGIPYGDPITVEKLEMIDEAEAFLLNLGLRQCRVTHHGHVAGIEVESPELAKMIMRDDLRKAIVRKFREIGFFHIAVHLESYVSGIVKRMQETHTKRGGRQAR